MHSSGPQNKSEWVDPTVIPLAIHMDARTWLLALANTVDDWNKETSKVGPTASVWVNARIKAWIISDDGICMSCGFLSKSFAIVIN